MQVFPAPSADSSRKEVTGSLEDARTLLGEMSSSRSPSLAGRLLQFLAKESLARRLQLAVLRRVLLDDHVEPLRHSKLGMFFYNLRGFYLFCGGLFFAFCAVGIKTRPAVTPANHLAFKLLACSWFLVLLSTLLAHKTFVRALKKWSLSEPSATLPRVFNGYFLFDYCILASSIVIARLLGTTMLDWLVFAIVSHLLVYAAYRGPSSSGKSLLVATGLLLGLVVLLLLFNAGSPSAFPRATSLLVLFPVLSLCVITILAIFAISSLRAEEEFTASRRLEILGLFQLLLSGSTKSPTDLNVYQDAIARANPAGVHNPDLFDFSTTYFRKRAHQALSYLCSLGDPFWYRSACLWLLEHHGERGDVLLPAVAVNFPEAVEYAPGISRNRGYLDTDSVMILPSLSLRDEPNQAEPAFRPQVDAPAACTPLYHADKKVGILALYGELGGPPVQSGDREFLQSLGVTLSNALDQSQRLHQLAAYKELDDLLLLPSLDEVFSQAILILNRYLVAAGCMVVFRPPGANELVVAASVGFDGASLKQKYNLTEGLTGKSASQGETIRIDDVASSLHLFDSSLLRTLRRAHGQAIHSWLCIPIGRGRENLGVIKAVNRRFRCPWFTDSDVVLGENLALRLQFVIKSHLRLQREQELAHEQERLANEAGAYLREAISAQEQFKREARERQDDIMNVTHQLQGPLASVIVSLSNLETALAGTKYAERLKRAHGLAQDCLTLCNGTFLSLAKEAGEQINLQVQDIDILTEVRLLAERLQFTNARYDLKFAYSSAPGFPRIGTDRHVFVSVMYSLIHNAMKYAEQGSRVELECGLEKALEVFALKVKTVGEVIQEHERELVFQKFQRGYYVKHGRHHRGVGLGLWVARQLMRAVGGDLTLELTPAHPRLSVFVVQFAKEVAV